MKKLLILVFALGTLVACKKHGDCKQEQTVCATVNSDQIPIEVANAFANKYSTSTIDVWFNQDNKGYTAMFDQSGTNTFAMFETDGTFTKEYSEKDRDDYYNGDYDKADRKGKKHHKHHEHKKDYKKSDSCICKVDDDTEWEDKDEI